MRRVLPHNLDAEASVLGGVLLRREALAQLDTLETEMFYDHRHKVVYQAMRNLEATSRPIDVVTLEHEIEKQGKFAAIGGMSFLGELALRVPIVDNVVAYAQIVEERYRIRELMVAASEITERGYEADVEADEYFSTAMAALARLDRARPDAAAPIGEMVRRRLAEVDRIAEARGRGELELVGVPTGIATLDKHVGGYPYDLCVLAARPAMGKTAMAMAAVDAATAAGYGAIVFGAEGGWRMMADRALSRRSGVAVERIRNGEIDRVDASSLVAGAAHLLKRDNWIVDHRAGLSASEIVRTARRWRSKVKNLRLVVVDYVQILRRARGLEHNENAALDEIVTTFSNAAVNDEMCYLALSQLNRKVEERNDKRPVESDLRGSGALEERPRLIVSPYRGSKYFDQPTRGVDYDCDCIPNAPCPHGLTREQFEAQVQVLVLKNSNGATGRVFASWRAPTTEMW